MEVGRSREKWEGPKGENAVVHMRRLAREEEELQEKQWRHDLGEEAHRATSTHLISWMTHMKEPTPTHWASLSTPRI
jgi:hypothetical protein